MALYHLSAKVIKRSSGQSAVACAAYRSGQNLNDERYNKTYNYQNKGQKEGIKAFILAPEKSPEWVYDREKLWNKVEAFENRKDAQLAREIVCALPIELNKEENQKLITDFVNQNFVNFGMVADVALHKLDSHNPHAHIMLSLREVDGDGFKSKKNRDWNKSELLELWRERWEEHLNKALEQKNVESRVTHKSFKDLGIDLLPTVKMGVASKSMERKGIRTERGDINRQIKTINRLKTEVKQLESEIKIETKKQAQEQAEMYNLQSKNDELYETLKPHLKNADVPYIHHVPKHIQHFEKLLNDDDQLNKETTLLMRRMNEVISLEERQKRLKTDMDNVVKKAKELGKKPEKGIFDIFNKNKQIEIDMWERSWNRLERIHDDIKKDLDDVKNRLKEIAQKVKTEVINLTKNRLELLKNINKLITPELARKGAEEEALDKRMAFKVELKQVQQEPQKQVVQQVKTTQIHPTYQEPKWGRYDPEPDEPRKDLTM